MDFIAESIINRKAAHPFITLVPIYRITAFIVLGDSLLEL
jgi:hypothetical protein